jgi:hypothetical protein
MQTVVNEEQCPDCGAMVRGGRAGCQALFDELGVLSYSDYRYGAAHALAVDAYSMQHPERYGRSAKSYAAHLTRLCCGVEHGGAAEMYGAIQRWLNGSVPLEKPAVLSRRGALTIADLDFNVAAPEYTERVRAWAASVWAAYEPQHELARNWLRAALDAQSK